ncbi:MAG TPA: glycosyltransferase [bacterium]|nr:glycosyltransferase [bacterium]
MRIGMFSESYLPRISGVTHSLAAFVAALRAKGHHVVVVAPAFPGHVDDDPDIFRLPSIRIPQQRDFPLMNVLALSTWREVGRLDLDLIHTHSPFLVGRLAEHLARRRRVPLVFTHHTIYDEYLHYVPLLPPALTRPVTRRYVTAYANQCDLVIAPSSMIAARLRSLGVRSRVEILPTGVVDEALTKSLDPSWVRPAFGIPAGRALLVTASRLGREKSIDLLLQMFAVVVKQRDAMLLIVGGGPEEQELKDLAGRLGVADRTVFAGQQPHQRTLECVSAGDIFVFASQTETQGLAVVEAMAAGKAVVAVGAGGVTDAIENGVSGELVPASVDNMAGRVLHLIDHPVARAGLGARAREASRRFSPEAAAGKLVHLYQSLKRAEPAG